MIESAPQKSLLAKSLLEVISWFLFGLVKECYLLKRQPNTLLVKLVLFISDRSIYARQVL